MAGPLSENFEENPQNTHNTYGDVNAFRDLCAFHPISQNEIRVITHFSDGDWEESDLHYFILKPQTKRDLILAAFDMGFLSRMDVTRLSKCLSEPHDFVMFLLGEMDHAAIRYWRDPDTGETLLQRYMYAYVNMTDETSDEMALYMIETIGVDPLAGSHTPAIEMLIRRGYFRSIAKLISMGIGLGPIDKIVEGIDSFIGTCIYWRANELAHHHPTDLEQLARTITTLTDGGYACVTDMIRQKITTNGFHLACPALAAPIA